MLVRALCVVIAVALLTSCSRMPWSAPESESSADGSPLTEFPYPSSPFRNARLEVKYVGSQACRECHKEQSDAYERTSHSQSLSLAGPSKSPPPGEFDHSLSHRRYRIEHDGSQVRHSALLLSDSGASLPLESHVVKYSVGSGHFGHSYLVEAGDFLVQSPITWFSSTKQWGMSPGYDRPVHADFTRITPQGCLDCHSGKTEAIDGNPFRLHFHELAIGCERCHGPGELHLARHHSHETAGKDDTIVHPARLSRQLAESICGQCHLQGEAAVSPTGRRPDEFRPGLPLEAFRIDFRIDRGERGMSVVGHMDQLRASACYQKTEHLSCVTCHDPHPQDAAYSARQATQKACLSCHASDDCHEPLEARETSAGNQCAVCHMPQAKVEVPHVAFTHHRIGVHREPDASPAEEKVTPRAVLVGRDKSDLDGFSDVEHERIWGLANRRLLNVAPNEHAKTLRGEALRRLARVRQEGVQEPSVEAAYAELAAEVGSLEGAEAAARRVLEWEPAPSGARADALRVLALLANDSQRTQEMVPWLEELARVRRDPRMTYLLAICERKNGHNRQSLAALKQTVEIMPTHVEATAALSVALEEAGISEESRRLRQLAQALMRLGSQGQGVRPSNSTPLDQTRPP